MDRYSEQMEWDTPFGVVYGWVEELEDYYGDNHYRGWADTSGTAWVEVGTSVSSMGAWAKVCDYLGI